MTEMSAARVIERSFTRYADQEAIIDVPNDVRMTYGELGDRVYALAADLRDRSPSKGDRVALLMKNRSEFIEIDLASTLVGKIRVGLNTRLSESEHRYILEDCNATTLFYDASFQSEVEGFADEIPVERFVSVNCETDFAETYGELVGGGGDPPDIAVSPDDPDYILYTSGTTGQPKGAVHTQSSRVAGTDNMLTDELTLGPDATMLHVAPLTHGSGSKVITFLANGGRNVLLEGFDPPTMLRAIRDEAVTHTFVVPTIIKRLVNYPDIETADVSSVEQITYGGEPISTAVLEDAIEHFGSVFTQVYGLSEAPHPVTVLPPEKHDLDEPRLLQSAGRPVLNVDVDVIDDDGTAVDIEEVGEIAITGPNVMAGYWENFDATNDAMQDGWFLTGDLGKLSEDGYLTIVGRKKDMIISGGLNVYPAQVEDVLQRHDAVTEVAVIGVPHDEWGEMVTAIVVPEENAEPSEDELVTFCEERIAKYKTPKVFEFASELPKGPTGKILKTELRDDQ